MAKCFFDFFVSFLFCSLSQCSASLVAREIVKFKKHCHKGGLFTVEEMIEKNKNR